MTFLIFYQLGRRFFRCLSIQGRWPNWLHMRAEIAHSAYTALIFGLMGVGLYLLRQAGFTKIYREPFAYGWAYLPLSFFCSSPSTTPTLTGATG